MTNDYKFEGWVAEDASAADGHMKWQEFQPKPWEETDIDVQVWSSQRSQVFVILGTDKFCRLLTQVFAVPICTPSETFG